MWRSMLKNGLGLAGAVVESARIEGDSIIVSARPRGRAPRRPVRGRPCDGYDRLPARSRARHRPVPRRLLVHRRHRRAREGGVAGGREGPGAQAPARWAEEGRGGPAGPCEEGQGPPLPLAQGPGEPHRGAGRRARRPQVHGHRALARLPAQGGVPRRLQGTGRGGGPGASGRVALLGVPLPHPAARGALQEGPAQGRGHRPLGGPRRLQRPRRGGQRQGQGGDWAGVRLQEHRQPHRARDAQMLAARAVPAGQGEEAEEEEGKGAPGGAGVGLPTHRNSRSLVFQRYFGCHCSDSACSASARSYACYFGRA